MLRRCCSWGFSLSRIAEAVTLVAEQMADLEIARFLEEKGEIWRRGLAGDSLSEDEHVSFDLLAYALFREQSHQLRRDVALSAEIDESQVRSYAFFVYQNPGLRIWLNGLIEVRSLTDRAYDLPVENRFYPKKVNDYLLQLDESSPELPDRYFHPY